MELSQLLSDHFQLIANPVGETATQTVGRRPSCQWPANEVHSFYYRTLADLPICEEAVPFCVHVRFFLSK